MAASMPKCAVCGNSTKKQGKKVVCETCGYSAEYSKDFEVPIDFMKEVQEEFHPLNVVSDLDKDEIKQNISDYLNYKTKLKAKEAELKLKQIENQLNKANSVVLSEDEGKRTVELPPSTFALNYLFKLPKEEREEFLQLLGEHPEWAMAFSYLISPASPSSQLPIFPPYFQAGGNKTDNGEVIANALQTMTSFFNSYLSLIKENMTQKNDSMVELLKALLPSLLNNQPNYAEIINAAQSNTISLLQTILQQNKAPDPLQILEYFLTLQSNANASGSADSEKGKTNDVLEILKLLLPSVLERSNKQTEDLLRALITMLKEKEERKDKRESVPVRVEQREQQSSIKDRLRDLKEEIEVLEELGVVQRPKPIVVEKDGEKYKIVEAEKQKEPSIEDKIKLEQWELEKEKKKAEIELLKKEKEYELEKKKSEEEREKEYELEKLRTFNTLINGGTQLAGVLFNSDEGKIKENDKIKKIDVLDEKDLEDVDDSFILPNEEDKKEEDNLSAIQQDMRQKEREKSSESDVKPLPKPVRIKPKFI